LSSAELTITDSGPSTLSTASPYFRHPGSGGCEHALEPLAHLAGDMRDLRIAGAEDPLDVMAQ